jgi:hypothetical protein
MTAPTNLVYAQTTEASMLIPNENESVTHEMTRLYDTQRLRGPKVFDPQDVLEDDPYATGLQNDPYDDTYYEELYDLPTYDDPCNDDEVQDMGFVPCEFRD